MPKLLIVDDEPNLLYSLKKSLQSDDLQVLTAATAEQGIAAVREHEPDAVILDVRLPDMSGLDAFNCIHEIDARVPVIIITAFSTTETAIEAMKRGAYEYLLKPVEFDTLYGTVERAIEISYMSRVPAMFEIEGRSRCDVGPDHWSLASDAGGLQGDWPSCTARRERVGARRERNGQGDGRASHLPAQPPK